MPNVTLQINLTPFDLPHAAMIVPHQLKFWSSQCNELLVIWDLDPGDRFERDPVYKSIWNQALSLMNTFNQALQKEYEHIRILNCQNPEHKAKKLAKRFFSNLEVLPAKDYRGRPILSYLYGLEQAKNDLVFHLDADILFVAEAQEWIAAACQVLHDEHAIVCVSPPGGPQIQPLAHRYSFFSARYFLIDRRRLYQQLHMVYRHPLDGIEVSEKPYAELLEVLISQWMLARSLFRLDLPAKNALFCALHPPVPADPDFIKYLPDLLNWIRHKPLPACQNGHYNLQLASLDFLKQYSS